MASSFQRVPLDLDKAAPRPDSASPSETPEIPASANVSGPIDVQEIEEKLIAALATCFDPEIPVNIYELGLVYDVKVAADGMVSIQMTLTSPACPVAGSLPAEVQAKARAVPGVRDAQVELVWDPPWTPERMSEAAKVQLGFF
jgi:FeS assembly SUF system protein